MKKINCIVSALLLTACVSNESMMKKMDTVFNVESTGRLNYDDGQYISISNMHCSDSGIVFELYQETSHVKKGMAVLHAGFIGIENVSTRKPLLIKTSKKEYKLKTGSKTTTFGTVGLDSNYSYNNYVVSMDVIKDIATSDVIKVKLYTLKNYRDGDCSIATLKKYPNFSQSDLDISNKYTISKGFERFLDLSLETFK